MKKIIVILTLGFLVGFSGTSQAYWHRCGWYRGCAPRVVVGFHPYYRPMWYAPHWGWDWRLRRNVWVRGYWR